MDYYVINRDSDTVRYENFSLNPFSDNIKRFSAVDGSRLDLNKIITKGLIEEGIYYSNSAIANAFSHITLWRRCIKENVKLTIFEDDAVLCANYMQESSRILESITENWDIFLWGYNFDSCLTIDLLRSITPCVVNFDNINLKKNINKIKNTELNSNYYKLIQAFGLVSYSITPEGAKKLLSICLPLKKLDYYQYGLNRFVKNEGIDHILSANYNRINSFCSFPPLVVTENSKENSTIHNDATYSRII